MQNIKPVLFAGLILTAVVCNHIFDWSSRAGGKDILEFLGRMAQEHMAAAILAYTAVTEPFAVPWQLLWEPWQPFWQGVFS